MKKEQISLNFDRKHADKMLRGGAVQLSPDYISGQKGHKLVCMCKKPVATRMRKALREGKSARVRLDELEDSVDGGSIRDFFRKLKEGAQKVGKFLKEKVIDTPLYQEKIRPLAKELVQKGLAAVQPIAGPTLTPLIQKGAEKLSEVTGAFGVAPYGYMTPMVYGGAMPVIYPQPVSNWSTLLMPPYLAQNMPYAGYGMPSGPEKYGFTPPAPTKGVSGGSFKAI